MKKATFYHAGCPVCVSAEQDILDTIDIYVEYIVFDTSVDSEIAGVGVKFSF